MKLELKDCPEIEFSSSFMAAPPRQPVCPPPPHLLSCAASAGSTTIKEETIKEEWEQASVCTYDDEGRVALVAQKGVRYLEDNGRIFEKLEFSERNP